MEIPAEIYLRQWTFFPSVSIYVSLSWIWINTRLIWIFMVRILDIRFHLICHFIQDQEVPTIWALRFPVVLMFVDLFIKVLSVEKNLYQNFYYSVFIWSSTCFRWHTAHHQEPKTALAASGFSYVEGCWTCSWWTLSGTVLCLTTSTNYFLILWLNICITIVPNIWVGHTIYILL
jgi:hypothetical protein